MAKRGINEVKGGPDFVIDYALLHELAVKVRKIKDTVKSDFRSVHKDSVLTAAGPNSAGRANEKDIGDDALFSALGWFYLMCNEPFHDAMERLEQLADTFDGVAKKFFDLDADMAAKANAGRLQSQIGQWISAEKAYNKYLATKDDTRTQYYVAEDGTIKSREIRIWESVDPPPKPDPNPPTSLEWTSGDLPLKEGAPVDEGLDKAGKTTTEVILDKDHRVTSETNRGDGPGGLAYKETTTYSYDAKGNVTEFQTLVEHSDGSKETIKSRIAPDGASETTSKTKEGMTTTKNVPGAGDGYKSTSIDPDGKTTRETVTDHPSGQDTKVVDEPSGTFRYEGDARLGSWILVEFTPGTSKHGTSKHQGLADNAIKNMNAAPNGSSADLT